MEKQANMFVLLYVGRIVVLVCLGLQYMIIRSFFEEKMFRCQLTSAKIQYIT